MTPLLQSLFARFRSMSWGARSYALVVVLAVSIFGYGAINDQRARSYERMHRRIAEAGARSTRSITVVDGSEESYFMALLGDFSGVAVTGVIGDGPDCTVDETLLRDLRRYPEVSSLRLSQMPLQSADFQQIYAVQSLSHLNLAYSNLSDADLEGLENLENLENLELQFTPLTDASVPILARLPGLSRLDISGTDITPAGAEQLRQAYRLMQGASSTNVLHRQAPSPRFRAAVIALSPTSSYGTSTRRTNLVRLQLRGDLWKEHEQNVPLLAELTDVEAVDIQQMPFSPELLQALAALPKLQTLNISDLSTVGQDLSKFAGSRSLRTVRLSRMTLDEQFSASLAKLESLETLNIWNCRLTPEACRALAQVRQVRSLQFRQLNVSPEEFLRLLSELEHFPHLRLLDLAEVPINNETIPRLGKLTQLVSLGLGSKEINDGAVPELCTFTHLQQLEISNTSISLASTESSSDGATLLETALTPASVRVVHSQGRVIYPLNLEELAAKAKTKAATPKANTIPGESAKGDKPPP